MARPRFQVCYIPRAKVVAAALAKGWVEGGSDGLLDVIPNFETFEEVDSEYPTLDEAVVRARTLVRNERDLFGQASVQELEYRLTVPADNYWSWEVAADHNVDETGLIETIRRDDLS